MVAEALDLIEGTSHDVSLGMGVHLETAAAQTQALPGLGNGYALKVRKPYTIKKQREKWTEEEHQRFLEALKLYGRSWRQIEEHVGTKNAIQIRSHAQKFFAKVARESNEFEGSLNPIEIPPPRPKKKPSHPYPRKVVDIPKTTLVDPHQPVQSPPPIRSGEERNSRSPTLVLSALASDTSGSPFSELQRSRLSPTSYATDDAHSAIVQFTENDNECMTSDSSDEEEKEYACTIPVTASATPDDKPTRELNLLTLGRAFPADDPATEPAPTTIKLFGRMVEIKENQKFSSVPENSEVSPSDSIKEKVEIKNGHNMMDSTANNIGSQVAFSLVPSCITPLACLVPQYALSEDCRQMGAVPHIVPLWTWSHGPVLPNLSLCNQTAIETVVDSPYKGTIENEELQREGSSTGSNSGSFTGANREQRNFEAVQSKNLTEIEKQLSAKGFVPYKRCLAERDATSSLVAAEKREGQRARVCS